MADADKIPVTQYGASTPTPTYSAPVVTTVTGRPGYEYDPHDSPGERAEGFFVGILFGKLLGWLGRLLGIATLDDPSGFMSTYREWHISWRGAYDGFRSKTFGDVPECPPLWQDEAQYYEGFAMFFNVVKCQWPTVAAFIFGYGGLKVTGIA